MGNDIEFVEAVEKPRCPSCDNVLERIEFTRQTLSFGFLSGSTWVVLLQCPYCHKVLGTQNW